MRKFIKNNVYYRHQHHHYVFGYNVVQLYYACILTSESFVEEYNAQKEQKWEYAFFCLVSKLRIHYQCLPHPYLLCLKPVL